MQMLTSYCDDSGNSRVAVVAGYIGEINGWEKKFAKPWRELLKSEGVKMMHRADLESFKGEYKGWDRPRQISFLRKAHQIIKNSTKVAVAAAVLKSDFEEVMPSIIKNDMGGPYGWCAHSCVNFARRWAEAPNRKFKCKIRWVFEKGTKGSDQISEMLNALSSRPDGREKWRLLDIEGWSFECKECIPLQSADVIAYEVFKQFENQIVDAGAKYPLRRSFADLFRNKDEKYMQYWDKARLRDWLRRYRVISTLRS